MFKLRYLMIIITVSALLVSALLYYQNSIDEKSIINATFGTGLFIIGPGLLIFVGSSGFLNIIVFYITKLVTFVLRDPRSYDMDLSIYLSDKNFVPPFTYMYMFIIGGIYLAVCFIMLYYYNLSLESVITY